jgi:hypothetical protein
MNLRPTAQKERNEFYRCLIEQGNDFIADWVNTETTLSLTELTQKWF